MHIKNLLPAAACVALAIAQEDDEPMDLTAALSSTPELSQLLVTLSKYPELVSSLTSAENITILAPSDEAFKTFASSDMGDVLNDTDAVMSILRYHVLNGTYKAEDVTEEPQFLPTLLTNETYTNVTGGQVVKAMSMGDSVMFISGLNVESTVTEADVMYNNGIVHIIDQLLAPPMNVSSTAQIANYTSLVGALTTAELVETVDTTPDLTIFAPKNAAFQAIGGSLANISMEDLQSTLSYHVVKGIVGYSTTLENGTSLETLSGDNVTITIEDGDIFVNSAKVVSPDLLVANGVVHGIDNVLNPGNATASPDKAMETQEPAFSGATSATEEPFTSDVPTPTATIGSGGGGAAEETSSDSEGGENTDNAAMPMKTGAMGVAALFGGAAVVYNM